MYVAGFSQGVIDTIWIPSVVMHICVLPDLLKSFLFWICPHLKKLSASSILLSGRPESSCSTNSQSSIVVFGYARLNSGLVFECSKDHICCTKCGSIAHGSNVTLFSCTERHCLVLVSIRYIR